MSSTKPLNELENLLSKAKSDKSIEPEAFIEQLVQSQIAVLLNKPIPVGNNPVLDADTQFLMVSDGADKKQPMMAVFTDVERARTFKKNFPSFPNVVKVHALWPLSLVPDGCGILINPNFTTGFRIGVEQAKFLKEQALKVLKG